MVTKEYSQERLDRIVGELVRQGGAPTIPVYAGLGRELAVNAYDGSVTMGRDLINAKGMDDRALRAVVAYGMAYVTVEIEVQHGAKHHRLSHFAHRVIRHLAVDKTQVRVLDLAAHICGDPDAFVVGMNQAIQLRAKRRLLGQRHAVSAAARKLGDADPKDVATGHAVAKAMVGVVDAALNGEAPAYLGAAKQGDVGGLRVEFQVEATGRGWFSIGGRELAASPDRMASSGTALRPAATDADFAWLGKHLAAANRFANEVARGYAQPHRTAFVRELAI